jgi:MFS family permease
MVSLMVAADGMEMTVISLLRSPLKREFGLDDLGFSMLGSTVFVGLLAGNLMGGFLADRFGRRATMLGVALIFCVFGLLSAFAPNLWIFAVSRFFTGLGVGSMVPVSDSHLLEWSPSAWRAKLAMTLTGVAFGLGAAFACVVGIVVHTYIEDDTWWRYMLAICVLPGIISLPTLYFFLPESPHYLIVHNRGEECAELMRKLAECNKVDGGALCGGKVAKIAEDSDDDWNPLHILGPQLRSTTLYCTVAWVVCGFVYYGHIFIYPVLLEDVYGMEIKEAYSTVLISTGVEVTVVIVAMFVMDVEGVGRRGAMALGFLLCWFCASLAPLSQNLPEFIAFNSCIKGIIEGPFTLIYIFAGELYPTTHRGTAVAFCNSFGRVAAIAAPPTLMAAKEQSTMAVFMLIAVFAFAGLLASANFTRETLGKPLLAFVSEVEEGETSLLNPGDRQRQIAAP